MRIANMQYCRYGAVRREISGLVYFWYDDGSGYGNFVKHSDDGIYMLRMRNRLHIYVKNRDLTLYILASLIPINFMHKKWLYAKVKLYTYIYIDL